MGSTLLYAPVLTLHCNFPLLFRLTYLKHCEGFFAHVLAFHDVMGITFNSVNRFLEDRLCFKTRLFPLICWTCRQIANGHLFNLGIYSAGMADDVYRSCYSILSLVLSEWNRYSCLLDGSCYVQPASPNACLWPHGFLQSLQWSQG